MIRDNHVNACLCGCGELIPSINKRGEVARFKHGHHRRGKIGGFKGRRHTQESKNRIARHGENHRSWKGGITIHTHGYRMVHYPEHPQSDSKGYVMEHRLIYEDFYKCCLLRWVIIHHIDENKLNNYIENLLPTTRGQHIRIHNLIKKKEVIITC